MEIKRCVHCGQELKYIAAGVSKQTGKPYSAFYVCLNKCKFPLPQFEQPNPKFQKPQTQQEVERSQQAVPMRDYEKEAYGKCKFGFLIEAFKLGMNLNEAERMAEEWTEASMRKMIVKKGVFNEYGGEEINTRDIPF